MSSIHELLKQVYPLKLRMELFNAIWIGWRADIKEKDQQIADLQHPLEVAEKALELACVILNEQDKHIKDLEAKLVESEKKASKKNDESWDLYLSLKQFYSRLGVDAYADDEIQDVAVKELNRLLNENEQLKQQLAEKDLKIIELETKLNLKDKGTNV